MTEWSLEAAAREALLDLGLAPDVVEAGIRAMFNVASEKATGPAVEVLHRLTVTGRGDERIISMADLEEALSGWPDVHIKAVNFPGGGHLRVTVRVDLPTWEAIHSLLREVQETLQDRTPAGVTVEVQDIREEVLRG